MTVVPTSKQPSRKQPGLRKRTWGQTPAAFFLIAALLFALVPLLIVEEKATQSTGPGETGVVQLTVDAPTIPGKLDLVLVIDRSTSYEDDLPNIVELLPKVGSQLAEDSDFRMGVATFIDGEQDNFDYVKEAGLTQDMNSVSVALNQIRPGGGFRNNDAPEMAISALDKTLTDFSFRDDAAVVVMLTTDAASKVFDGQSAEQVAERFQAQGIRIVVALVPESSATDYDILERQSEVLSNNTGGSVQYLSGGSSADLDRAVLEGVENIEVDLQPRLRPGCPADDIEFDPPSHLAVPGGSENEFRMSYRVPEDVTSGLYICTADLGAEEDFEFTLEVS